MMTEREYFVNCGGELKGPLSLDQLKMEVQAGRINSQDWVAAKGDPDWKPVGEVIAPAEVPPTLNAVPETKSVEPGGFHQLLAVAAMLLLLVHGGLDFWEWKVVMGDGAEGSEVIEESEPDEGPGGIESEFEFGAGSGEEEFEQALPPVWVGVVKAVVFPLALLLALAAFWQWDPNWWRGLIVFSVLLEALFGVIYFMSFYEVGLKAEGFLHWGSYIFWSVNRILLLLIWVSTCRASWMAPVGLLALAMAGMMLVDILTYIFIWPEGYGFSFLKGSIIQTISEKLSDMGDLGMYSWLGAKLTLTMATLIAVLPLALKKRPTR